VSRPPTPAAAPPVPVPPESAPELIASGVAPASAVRAGPHEAGHGRIPRWVVPTHIAAGALIQSTWLAIVFIAPILARKRFQANEWETLLITAAPTVFFSLSIFWNDLFRRRSLGPYLSVYWVWAGLPLALVAFAGNFWFLLIPYLLSCAGGAGYHPAAGELLRSLYPEKVRGRVYSFVWGSSMIVGAAAGFIVGARMDRNPDAFRTIFPIAAGLHGYGVLVFYFLARATGHSARRIVDRSEDLRSTWRRVTEPIGHAKEVLKADPIFARYEAAFMTYGVGWMICYALLPNLVVDKLKLSYESIAESTHVAYWVAMTAMIVPAGWLMDRIGAVRCTGLSFLLLTPYPIGLILSEDSRQLLITSIVYGAVHSGANVGWMLGPVALAPSPQKVAQYVAIHATLVGIRGKLFQFLGVALYALTKDFTLPLIIAALSLLWSAWQMWQLHQRMTWRRPGFCPSCGYDLKGVKGTRCPECGQEVLPVAPVETKH